MEEQTFYTHNSLHFKFIFTRIDCLQHLARNIRALDGLIKRRILNFSLERKKEKKILESFFSKNPIKREKKRERERDIGEKKGKKKERKERIFVSRKSWRNEFVRATNQQRHSRSSSRFLAARKKKINCSKVSPKVTPFVFRHRGTDRLAYLRWKIHSDRYLSARHVRRS